MGFGVESYDTGVFIYSKGFWVMWYIVEVLAEL